MNDILTIIPAAGFGTRVGTDSNKSKELMIDPVTNKPLIEYWLDFVVNPFLIIRKEKQDLIDYCNERGIQYMITETTKEWPQTVLKSKSFWKKNNILILPDTRFDDSPTQYDLLIKYSKKLGFAVHKVDDLSKWGAVKVGKTSEKPETTEKGYAWIMIYFEPKIGIQLFETYSKPNTWFQFPLETKMINVKNVKDITRSGKVEIY